MKTTNPEEQNIQFVNAEKLNVTGRIKEGKTAKFTCRKEAETTARIKGSYVYDLFYYVSTGGKANKNTEVKPFGFAVPN